MISTYKTALLLGSTKGNEDTFRHAEAELTKKGYIVMAPVLYGYDVTKPWHPMLTDMCEQKCKFCDLCVVVTPDHIGEATMLRIRQAIDMAKPVYVFDETDPGLLRPYEIDGVSQNKPVKVNAEDTHVLIIDEDEAYVTMLRVRNKDSHFRDALARAQRKWQKTSGEWEDVVYAELRKAGYDIEETNFETAEVTMG